MSVSSWLVTALALRPPGHIFDHQTERPTTTPGRASSETRAFARSLSFIERYPNSFILAFRFLYGLRMAGPVALGVTRVSALRFFILNFIGAVIWAATFTLAGYFFGEAIEAFFGQVKAFEHYVAWGVGGGIALFAAYHLIRWIKARRAG